MDAALSSTFSGALSQRESSTTVDTSGFGAPFAAEATMGDFNAAEIDFEASNWRAARNAFQNNPKHKDKKRMADFLSRHDSP